MILPALRLAHMRTWPEREPAARALHRELVGRAIGLPVELGHRELAAAVDTLAMFLELPMRPVPSPDFLGKDADKPALIVITRPCSSLPRAIPGSVLLAPLERAVGDHALDMAPELMRLRDAVIDCVGQHFSRELPPLHRLRHVAGWLYRISDSPATALAAVDRAARTLIGDPEIADRELYAAALGAAVGDLLSDPAPAVAEWTLAFALAPWQPLAHVLVGTEAALMGERIARRRAMNAGLLTLVETRPGSLDDIPTVVDLRRPLAALADLERAPGAPTLYLMARAIGEGVTEPVRAVLDRVLAPVNIPAILRGPRPPDRVIGRDQVLARLLILLAPGQDVPVCILWGMAGLGKTTVAARLGQLVRGRQQVIWLNLAHGPLLGLSRVAPAFRLTMEEDDWVSSVKERLRGGPYLVVFDDIDEVDEDTLANLLPVGRGRCAILLLARSRLPRVQRACDAVAIQLDGLDQDHAVALLGPDVAEEDARKVADLVDGHPLALQIAARQLEQTGRLDSLDERSPDNKGDELDALIEASLSCLEPREIELVEVLRVCGGVDVPLVLLAALFDGDMDDVLECLEERALIACDEHYASLQALVRLHLDQRGHDSPEYRALVRRHAIEVRRLFEEAEERIEEQDDLYPQVLLAMEDISEREVWTKDMADEDYLWACMELAVTLLYYERGSRAGNLAYVIQVLDTFSAIIDEPSSLLRGLLQLHVGQAMLQWPLDDSDEFLEQALQSFDIALELISATENPDAWAQAKLGKGLALRELRAGDEETNLRAAIAELEQAAHALEPNDEEFALWVEVQRHLAATVARLGLVGDAQARDRALDMFDELSSRLNAADMPESRAMVERELVDVLVEVADATPDEDARTSYLARAGAALDAIEDTWSPDESPRDWARLQFVAGRLARLPGPRAENLRSARAMLENSLSVFTRDEFPSDWASVQYELGHVFANFPAGDRAANLNRAIASFEAALQVFTPEAHPRKHEQTRQALARALQSLSELTPDMLVPEAPGTLRDPSDE